MEHDTCRIIRGGRGGEAFVSKQGLTYFTGVGAENAGARQLCLHRLVIPPSGRAKAHMHENHESAIYLIDGTVHVWWGERLGENARMSGGDFIYIPPSVPHLPVNVSATEPATVVVARTDPNEQESVVLLPELDALVGTELPPA